LLDSEPSVILVSQTYLDKAYQLRDEIPSLKTILVMDDKFQAEGIKNIYELPDIYDAKWRVRSGKAVALIIYTSGTTGAPKGVEITFGNITSQLIITKDAFDKILPDNRRV
jgi:long-chain acyl-CoA synthetase